MATGLARRAALRRLAIRGAQHHCRSERPHDTFKFILVFEFDVPVDILVVIDPPHFFSPCLNKQ